MKEPAQTRVEPQFYGYNNTCVHLTCKNLQYGSIRRFSVSTPYGAFDFAKNQLVDFPQNRKDNIESKCYGFCSLFPFILNTACQILYWVQIVRKYVSQNIL